MAQFRTDKKIIDSGQVTTRYEVNMLSDQLTPSGSMRDAFGRMRTSDPHTLFDSTLRFTDDTRNWSTSNTGTSSYTINQNASLLEMTVGTSAGDEVVRQTKRYFAYQPGKSHLVYATFNMEPKSNVRQRVGYFDINNGIFIEHDGTGAYIVKRSKSSGSTVETRIPQSEWSDDKFDGTGTSGVDLDLSKTQIFWVDVEWLGAGTVRVGFVVDGVPYVAHKFHHANNIEKTYLTSATLPVRYEITNTGATSSNTTLDQICCSVQSEGGHSPRVSTRSISTPLAGITVPDTVFKPVIAIRLKSTRIGGVVIPSLVSLAGLQNTPYVFQVFMDSDITGGTWVSSSDESHVEYNITGTALTGGKNLLQGLFNGGTSVQPVTVDFRSFNGSYQLRATLDNKCETFVIGVKATTNNDKVIASLAWEEIN